VVDQVLIVGCKKLMIGNCVACSRCLDAMNNRADNFSVLSPNPQCIGLLDCGDCPGIGMNCRLNEFHFWNQTQGTAIPPNPPAGVLPTHIFIGNCITAKNSKNNYICPYAENIIEVITSKAAAATPAITVVSGTHSKGKPKLKPRDN
jgi:predicted metal-binding protein